RRPACSCSAAPWPRWPPAGSSRPGPRRGAAAGARGEKAPPPSPRTPGPAAGGAPKAGAPTPRAAPGTPPRAVAPAPPASAPPGMRKQQEIIRKHFEGLGGKVEAQTFNAKQVSRKNAVEMTNLVVSWFPERKRRVILCSHYDTRPIADQEPDPRKWREKFVS